MVPADDECVDSGPVVRRPTTTAPRTKSKLRVSFNPGDEDATSIGAGTGPGEDLDSIPPSKSSRLGLSSAAQSILNRTSARSQEDSEGPDYDRPKYSKAYLDELKNSTPSTPHDLSSGDSPSLDLIDLPSDVALDLESKFGKAALSGSSSSRILTAAEIRERKERRARLAKEQAANTSSPTGPDSSNADFIPFDDYDSDGEFRPRRMQVGSYIPPTREKDTRLLHDDEEIAEGFDEFVDDPGRVTLSRKERRKQTLQEREAIRSMIEDAEGSEDSSGAGESDSDYERHQHYELAQTHHGMDGLRAHAEHTRRATRPRQPRETTLIPKLSAGLGRLRDVVSSLEFERARIEKRRADIVRERAEIKASQEHIQSSLEEAGRELERVSREYLASRDATGPNGGVDGLAETNGHSHPAGSGWMAERGLESFGDTPESTG